MQDARFQIFFGLKNILTSKNIIYLSYFTNLNNYTKPERPSTFIKYYQISSNVIFLLLFLNYEKYNKMFEIDHLLKALSFTFQ